jgi:hypothetical protein
METVRGAPGKLESVLLRKVGDSWQPSMGSEAYEGNLRLERFELPAHIKAGVRIGRRTIKIRVTTMLSKLKQVRMKVPESKRDSQVRMA